MNRVRHRTIAGFTLLELVIALAIVSVLAAIAYPAFKQRVVNGRRADGSTALLDLANRMEQYYANNNTFATATIAGGTSTDVLSSSASNQGYYTLSITAQAKDTYTIKATRTGQQTNDTQCGDFTLTSAGVKAIVNNASGFTVARCW